MLNGRKDGCEPCEISSLGNSLQQYRIYVFKFVKNPYL